MTNGIVQDIKYALRMLRKSPGFAATAILTLALGIGANTAIFSVVSATLLARPAYTHPERIVNVWEFNREKSFERIPVSPGNFLHWRQQSSSFDQLAALYDFNTNLTGAGEPERIPAQAVTPEMISLLGVSPHLGRAFVSEDGEAGKDNVVMLSYGLWQRRFAADPGVIGRTIVLDDRPLTVIGVMPAGFQFFIAQWSSTGEKAELWEPIAFNAKDWSFFGRFLTAVGRLKPGVTLAQAQSEMNGIADGLAKEFPESDAGLGIDVLPLHEQLVQGIRPALLILMGAVGFVLLIACANVANLQLARAAARHRELAVRAALGASRWRIARQLLMESVIVAIAGAAAGVLLAQWAIVALLAAAPRSLADIHSLHIDLRVLCFTAALAMLTGVLFGLAPALQAMRRDVNESLKEDSRGAGHGTRSGRLRRTLVIAETALAVVLLIGAVLLIRSFARLQAVWPGFDPHNMLAVKIDLPQQKYAQPSARIQFFRQLLDRVRVLPGVVAASGNAFLPFTGVGSATDFYVIGRPVAPALSDRPIVDVRVVEPDYFQRMRIPLLHGRFFNEREMTEQSGAVIISETMARQQWPNQDPLGQRIVIDMEDDNTPSTIIGIVGDVKYGGLDSTPQAMAYWPHPELPYPFMTLIVRTSADPLRWAGPIQEQVRALDKDLPVSKVRTMEQWISESVAQARFSTFLLATFAGVALALAVVGIYGLMAYAVEQRTREIGIRMALGAQISDVLRMVAREGFALALTGVAAGVATAFAITRLLRSLLFEISALDPWTFAGVAVLLSAVAMVACVVPARRAIKVDPMSALHHE